MKRLALVEFYKADDGYRWRLWSANRKNIIAESGEAYSTRAKCQRGARATQLSLKPHNFVTRVS